MKIEKILLFTTMFKRNYQMKTVDKLRTLFQKIDEAKNSAEIEVLGIEVN